MSDEASEPSVKLLDTMEFLTSKPLLSASKLGFVLDILDDEPFLRCAMCEIVNDVQLEVGRNHPIPSRQSYVKQRIFKLRVVGLTGVPH